MATPDNAAIASGARGFTNVQLPAFNVTETFKSEYLWFLGKRDQTDTLPVLQRKGRGNFNKIGGGNAGVGQVKIYTGTIQPQSPIDVVKAFPWTKTPANSTARTNIPYIILTERRLLMNSNVSNIANSVFAGGQAIKAGANSITNLLNLNRPQSSVPQSLAGNQPTSILDSFKTNSFSLTDTVLSTLNGAANSGAAKAIAQIGQSLENFTNQNFDTFNNSVLSPYDYLYATEPTGFIYKLPYLDNQYSTFNTKFGDNADSSLLAGVAGSLRSVAEDLAGLTNFLKPGTYIEKAKQFSMGDSGRVLQVKFPLLNTGEFSDISNNWQLIFGLIYQNRPGRVTRSIIDMPVIYEVSIPGVTYMPYAYINSLSVSFLGNRRMMKIRVPISLDNVSGSTEIETVVPDAYEITIGIEGMNDETRNFLFANVNPANVTVTSQINSPQ